MKQKKCVVFLQIVVFAALVAYAYAAPQSRDADATILKYDSDNIGVDGYNFAYVVSAKKQPLFQFVALLLSDLKPAMEFHNRNLGNCKMPVRKMRRLL